MSSLGWMWGHDGPAFPVLRPGSPHGVLEKLRRDLGGAFAGAVAAPTRARTAPPVNVYETPEEIVLTAELPGVALQDIELSVDGDRLTLRGERRIELPEGAKAHRVERRAGAFERGLTLPAEADVAAIQAVYRNGILLVKVPKAPAAKPRRIPVDTAS